MKTDLVVMGGIALGVAGLGYLAYRRLAGAIDSGALDPTNRNNVAYSGVNKVGEALTGEKGWSLGGWIYDITHQEETERLLAPTPLPLPKKGQTK